MTGWAGFWVALGLVLSTLLVMTRVDAYAVRIWPTPPPAPAPPYDRCPYAPGC